MKTIHTVFLLNRVLLVGTILGLTFFQGCDITQQNNTFENPYTKKTEQIFAEVSDAVFGNIAENLDNAPNEIISVDGILQYANKGYTDWARKNDATINAFNAGFTTFEALQKKQNENDQVAAYTSNLKNILKKSELTNDQKKYILKIPEIIKESGHILELKRNLNVLDKEAFEQLGEEDSKVVLQMSALMQSTMDFLITNSKKLEIITTKLMKNKSQSHFYIPRLQSKEDIFLLAQAKFRDPPEWDDYFSTTDLGVAVIFGVTAGTLIGINTGIKVGSLGGPWGAGIGGAIGGVTGFIVGGAGAGGYYYENRLNAYNEAKGKWCGDAINYSHPAYDNTCRDEK